MRYNSIRIAYQQSKIIVRSIGNHCNLYRYPSLLQQFSQKHLFCTESPNKIKKVSLDDLLSAADPLLPSIKKIESENVKQQQPKFETIDQSTTQQQLEDDDDELEDEYEDDEEDNISDDEIDAIIDEIESKTNSDLIPISSSSSLQTMDNYLPSINKSSMIHSSFKSMNLRKKLEKHLCKIHGLSPLPIQSMSYDKILSYRSEYAISGSIIESSMGSGKTLAYLLPIMNNISPLQCGQVVIVVPSNELGMQVKSMLKSYLINTDDYKHNHATSSYLSNNNQNKKNTKQFNLQHCVMNCNSNESLDYNIDYIRKISPSVIIGTAKRIRELFLYSVIKPSKIDYIIFDEIDTLFPIKSKTAYKNKKLQQKHANNEHLKPSQLILNGIIKQQQNFEDSNHKCHAIFVGATIPNQLKGYLNQLMQPHPVQLISTYNNDQMDYMEPNEMRNINPNKSGVSKYISPNIVHQYISVDNQNDKAYIISSLINKIRSNPDNKKLYNPAVLIFLTKNSSPIKFAEELSGYDIKSCLLHEYLNDKALRSKFLKLFRSGQIDAVIATESISRGLDFIWLDHIIIAEMPYQDASYLHISGRCSRLNSKGFVTSIVDEYEEDQLKKHCFKYQLNLTELDSDLKINDLSKQKRKYNKLNTFPLLLENPEYQKRLKKQLYLTNTKSKTLTLPDSL